MASQSKDHTVDPETLPEPNHKGLGAPQGKPRTTLNTRQLKAIKDIGASATGYYLRSLRGAEKVDVCHKGEGGIYKKITIAQVAHAKHVDHGDGKVGDAVPDRTGYFFDGDCLLSTSAPTDIPTQEPTSSPTDIPTEGPTSTPTDVPTEVPTSNPTSTPTIIPSNAPTSTPSGAPTLAPTPAPTLSPTAAPTPVPTNTPSNAPTDAPTTCESYYNRWSFKASPYPCLAGQCSNEQNPGTELGFDSSDVCCNVQFSGAFLSGRRAFCKVFTNDVCSNAIPPPCADVFDTWVVDGDKCTNLPGANDGTKDEYGSIDQCCDTAFPPIILVPQNGATNDVCKKTSQDICNPTPPEVIVPPPSPAPTLEATNGSTPTVSKETTGPPTVVAGGRSRTDVDTDCVENRGMSWSMEHDSMIDVCVNVCTVTTNVYEGNVLIDSQSTTTHTEC